MKFAPTVFLLFALACPAASDSETTELDFEKHPELITFDCVRTWHAQGGLKEHSAPRARYLDLNGDGREEVFLGLAGAGRFMTYALFTKTSRGWILLSDKIIGSIASFEILPSRHDEWHDFMTVVPTWRGRGYWRFTYTWNGKRYVDKTLRETRDDELSHE